MDLNVTILGSGTSTGVPMLGCKCAVCQSSHPRNYRTRVSIAVTANFENIEESFVIDTGPEFRIQMVKRKNCAANPLLVHAHARRSLPRF